MVNLYREISGYAGDQGAIYIGAKTFSHLALASLVSDIQTTTGQVLELAVPPFGVRLDKVEGSAGPITTIPTRFEVTWPEVQLRSTQQITFTFTFGILDAGVLKTPLATLTLQCLDLAFDLDVGPAAILCSAGDARLLPSVARASDFDTLIQDAGLDLTTATRVEGMLLYSGLANAISRAVLEPCAVDLTALFPGVRFSGKLKYDTSSDFQYLFITGELEAGHGICECADVGTGVGGPGQVTPHPDANPDLSDPQSVGGGSIEVQAPRRTPPNAASLGPRRLGQGENGVYLPRAFLEPILDGPYPAARVDVSKNGFVGWKATGIVDFSGFKLTIDKPRGRLLVDLDFRAEVYGSIHVDLGKLGKIRVTSFSAEQSGPGANHIQIAFYLVLSEGGVYLKPVVEVLTFGKYDVYLRIGTLVGTPFGAWGAVIGYIFDTILGKLIAHDIPHELDEKIRDYMGQVMFTILEAKLSAMLSDILPQRSFETIAALFDGDADGLLASSGILSWDRKDIAAADVALKGKAKARKKAAKAPAKGQAAKRKPAKS